MHDKVFTSLEWAISDLAREQYNHLVRQGLDADIAFAMLENALGEALYDLPPKNDESETEGET